VFKDILGQSWEAMVYNRRRTAITMIGMAWGIATVVLLLAYGAGFSRAIEAIFAEWGTNIIGTFPGRTSEQAGGEKSGVQVRFTDDDVDRLANAVCVSTKYGFPAIVVDFGTAVTFDVISRKGVYEGGVIAPGLGVMVDYMYQRTALLPKIDLEEPVSAIGKSTRDAMLAGAVFGYRGLVRRIVTEIVAVLDGKARIIATGSYADLIAAKLPELQIVDLDLTLEGLRIIALRNFKA